MTTLFRLALVVLWTAAPARAAEPSGRYKKIVDELVALESAHAGMAKVFSIGANDEGTEIYAIRVSLTPGEVDPGKIGQLMVSTHHGNELRAPLYAMAFIRDLLRRYESRELWEGRLAETEWTVVPVLNVTGYNRNQREEYGKDPNRDYPNPCTNHTVPRLKSIALAMALTQSRPFVGNVTVHGYDGSLTYPWSTYTDNTHTPDHDLYHRIFTKAAELNGYRVGTAADVVYPANGCYEDYVYWKHGHWSLLVELRDGSTADIDRTVRAVASFYEQLDASPSNQHDFTGKCTGRPGLDLRVE